MKQILPLTLSAFTVLGMWLIGNKNRLGWVVGLINQILWISFAIIFKAWGLLPLTLVLIIVYTRNLLKWSESRWHDNRKNQEA